VPTFRDNFIQVLSNTYEIMGRVLQGLQRRKQASHATLATEKVLQESVTVAA
jgi:hypothetical protein